MQSPISTELRGRRMLRRSRYVVTVPVSDDEYLFVNTFTGDIIQGTKEVQEILESDHPEECDEEVLSVLISCGFLTELTFKEETEYAFEKLEPIRKLHEKNLFFILILTYECNMRCNYCFQSYVFGRDTNWLQQRMSFEQVDAAFEAMDILHPDAEMPVHLFGGEPLLYHNYDLVQYVLEKGTSLGKSFIIVTNGLEADTFLPLLTNHDITYLQITLDGIQEIHDKRKKKLDGTGSFCDIVHSMDQLIEAGVEIHVRVVFDHSTVNQLPALMEFFTQKGWDSTKNVSMYVTPQRHHTQGGCMNFVCNLEEEDLDFLVEEESVRDAFWNGLYPLREKLGLGIENWLPSISYCRNKKYQMWLDPFGDIYLCTDTLGDTEHAVGTYYPELYFNEQYYRWKKRTIFNMKSCRHCKYAMICGGGCGHYTYHEKGGILNPDCTFSKQARTIYYPLIWRMLQKSKNRKG